MQFTVEDHDMGTSFLVHLEDDSYALVDIMNKEVYRDEPDSLMSQGFWVEASENPVPEETIREIGRVLEQNA